MEKLLKFLNVENVERKKREKALKLYNNGLRTLYKHFSLLRVSKELYLLNDIIGNRTKFHGWSLKFIFLLTIYKFSGREYKLKAHLFNLGKLL